MRRPGTLSMDLDGTLLQSPYWRLHLWPWLQMQANRRHAPPLELWRQMLGESQRRLQAGGHAAAYDWQDIARECLGVFLADPPAVDRARVLPLVYPDVWDFLRWLASDGRPAVIVTNGLTKNQAPYVQSLGWDRIFPRVIGADSGWAKPDPRIFDTVPDLAAHIGDRVGQDVLGALRAGAVAIHLRRPKFLESQDGWDPLGPALMAADAVIDSLAQAPDALNAPLASTARVRRPAI